MSEIQKFSEEKVLWVKRHSPKHLTFAISRPESYRFEAGQFSRLGFYEGEGFIWRAYSVISAEYADTLEYCSTKPRRAFSCPAVFPTAAT